MATAMKMTFSPEDAAAYLNISVEELSKRVKRGDLRLHSQGKRKYHLAGEVDVLKSMIIHENNARIEASWESKKAKDSVKKKKIYNYVHYGQFRD